MNDENEDMNEDERAEDENDENGTAFEEDERDDETTNDFIAEDSEK